MSPPANMKNKKTDKLPKGATLLDVIHEDTYSLVWWGMGVLSLSDKIGVT